MFSLIDTLFKLFNKAIFIKLHKIKIQKFYESLKDIIAQYQNIDQSTESKRGRIFPAFESINFQLKIL